LQVDATLPKSGPPPGPQTGVHPRGGKPFLVSRTVVKPAKLSLWAAVRKVSGRSLPGSPANHFPQPRHMTRRVGRGAEYSAFSGDVVPDGGARIWLRHPSCSAAVMLTLPYLRRFDRANLLPDHALALAYRSMPEWAEFRAIMNTWRAVRLSRGPGLHPACSNKRIATEIPTGERKTNGARYP